MSVSVEPIPIPAECSADTAALPLYRLSVAQYHAMARAGILTENDPVELLEGRLVQKMTKHKPHSIATRRVRTALDRLVSDAWYVESQEPVTTADSEPEPDVFVARAEIADDPARHPEPREVPLIVEVADSSLSVDRGTKKRLYAQAGILVYWIVNLIDRQIEVYTEPTGIGRRPTYRQRRDYRPGDEIPVLLDGAEIGRIPVESLLP